MACRLIQNPKTGEEIRSNLWDQINSEVSDETLADKLFAQTRSENFRLWFGDVYNQNEPSSQVVNENGEPLMVYHASSEDFDTFDLSKSNEVGFHFGTLAAATERLSPSKMVFFENDSEEGTITELPLEDRIKNLKEDGNTLKPYFLNLRNMIEGVDNLDFDGSKLKEEDKVLLNYLDEATYPNDFKRLVLAFYQKGKISYDDVNQILSTESSLIYDGLHGPEALIKALGSPDGYWYYNSKEDEGSKSYVVFDPNNVKSLHNNGQYSKKEDNTLWNINQNEVNYSLKAINILQSKEGDEIFRKGDKNGWDLFKILSELKVPKEQISLIQAYNTRNREEILVNLLADYSYTIEINTAKDNNAPDNYIEDQSEYYENQIKYADKFYVIYEKEGKFIVYSNDFNIERQNSYGTRDINSPKFNTRNEAEKYREELVNDKIQEDNIKLKEVKAFIPQEENTQYYSNLTVPGGTNYTENEIATPAITPSIKGHAAFATDKGIGWFRGDEQILGGKQDLSNTVQPTGDLEIDAINIEYIDEDGYPVFKTKPKTVGGAQTKTRRILEVQSDLFQKGRDKTDLTTKDYGLDSEFYRENFDSVEEMKKYEKTAMLNKNNSKENQFLQLLNKDNNWVTFFVKSIIQDSAKEGYEKILFPSGNTAAKVEGHETVERFIKNKEDRIKILKEDINIHHLALREGNTLNNRQLDSFNTKKEAEDKVKEQNALTKSNQYVYEYGNLNEIEIKQLEKEIEDAKTGKLKISSIAKFYEETIKNVLDKQGFAPIRITDEYGNGWYEVDLTNAKVKEQSDLVLLNLKLQGHYKTIPEYMLNELSKKGILSRRIEDFGDRWYFTRGLGSENAKDSKINFNIGRFGQFMSMNNLNQDMFLWDNTTTDQAPFITVNSEFNELDTIQENNDKIKEEKYNAIISFFQEKFGINKDRIVRTTKTKFKEQFPDIYKEGGQSVYHQGKFYFFTNNLTSDITVEELLHPFIFTVKDLNPELFKNLLKEAQKAFPKLNTKIQALYADRTKSVRDQELVTQAMSRIFNDIRENEDPQTFLETIKDFIFWLRNIMNDLFNYFKTGKYINIPIDKLPVQTSMYEIAKLLNATDTRFDIIYPSDTMFALEPDSVSFNKAVESILTDQKVSAKINKLFSGLPFALKEVRNKLNDTINENEKKNLQNIIKTIENLENEDNQNLIAFQLKGIIASVQMSNELARNLEAMKNSDSNDNIKLSYYMSVYKTTLAMDSFKKLITDLKFELTNNLVLPNTQDVSTFLGFLNKATSAESDLIRQIQDLVKAPLLNKLVENSEYVYLPKLESLKSKIEEIDSKINNPSISQAEKNNLFNKVAPLRRELKTLLETAPSKENFEKQFAGEFKDANFLSYLLESNIVNGNPLVATLQNIINDIYDLAGANMLQSKNEAQTWIEKYTKATGISLRDQDKRYEQIRDLVKIPTDLKENDKGELVFEYVSQDTLLSSLDNSYLTEYLELEMKKNFYLSKHKENVNQDKRDEDVYNKYKEALEDFKKFVKDNSEKEFTEEIYELRAIMDEKIGDKTLREITGDLYHQLDDLHQDLQGVIDSDSAFANIQAQKDIHIELKRLRTEYDENGNKKTGDELLVSQLLTKYNKLRDKYYKPSISYSQQQRYEFDLQELEKKKQQYIDSNSESIFNKNLLKIQEQVISQDYFFALSSISGEINELSNELSDLALNSIAEYVDTRIFKEQKKDIYTEIRELSKPYRDEEGVIDGITMSNRHPEVTLKIKELQQYLEDLKYETSKIANLSLAESEELKSLQGKEQKSQEEQDRQEELQTKRKVFSNFRKENKALLTRLNSLYQQLNDLSTTFTTDYYDKEIENQLLKIKADPKILKGAEDFLKQHSEITINGVYYEKGGEGRDVNTWYREQIIANKSTFEPLNRQGTSGYNEMLDITASYIANLNFKETEWWKNNHYDVHKFNEKTKSYDIVEIPIYIWQHQSPNNPNFIETKPAKQYFTYEVKDGYKNSNFKTTYRGIPIPKSGKFENKRYKDLDKNNDVFKFLDFFTKKYHNVQEIYEAKGDYVKMGNILPAVVKTTGENEVNTTNKILAFDGTFKELFKDNIGETDRDSSYLIGGGQSNNKAIPIRFVGKMDTRMQSKNMVASILLFEYHASLYEALNESLPIFEAAKLVASSVNVTTTKSPQEKLTFLKKIGKLFSSKRHKDSVQEKKDTEKSVLSKSVDNVLDIFVYGQRMKTNIIDLGPLGKVDLAKVSAGILGFAAKTLFLGNIISAINNSLSTRLQVIINSGVKGDLYSLKNIMNAQALAPKYTKDLLSDWTKLGNKSLIGQVLERFAFLHENPSREITSKAEFTLLKNKMELLASPKQMSEFEVLFLQFLTMADATPITIKGKVTKLSKIEDIFELKDGKLEMKKGVEFTKEQEKLFRGRYQVLARKVAGAYRQTEISSIETNWAGKSAMFLRRYFVSLATNRFSGDRFSFQENDVYTGYQRQVVRNMITLFSEYKGNVSKYWDQLSDKEKGSHLKMLKEYGLLILSIAALSLLGGGDDKKDLKKNSWAYNMMLVSILRAKNELEQFTAFGTGDFIRMGKNPFMVFQTLGNINKTFWLIGPTIWGSEDAFYQQNTGLHDKGDSKLLASFLKTFGITFATFHPEEYLVTFRSFQKR